jgi:amidase
MAQKSWEEIAAVKREELLASIPKEWIIPKDIKPSEDQLDVTSFPEKSGWFTDKELEITSKTAVELIEKLHNGTWTSEEVTLAFCKRAAAAHQLVRNTIYEPLILAK